MLARGRRAETTSCRRTRHFPRSRTLVVRRQTSSRRTCRSTRPASCRYNPTAPSVRRVQKPFKTQSPGKADDLYFRLGRGLLRSILGHVPQCGRGQAVTTRRRAADLGVQLRRSVERVMACGRFPRRRVQRPCVPPGAGSVQPADEPAVDTRCGSGDSGTRRHLRRR